MAIEISAFPFAQPATTDYPSGDITDAAPGVTPTPVDSGTNGDLQQLPAKLMREAGLTFNGVRDNTSNGWQLYEAFLRNARAKWVSGSMPDLNGTTLTFAENNSHVYTNASTGVTSVTIDETDGLTGNEFFGIVICLAGTTLSFASAGSELINVFTGVGSLTIPINTVVYFTIKYLGAHQFAVWVYAENGATNTWMAATPGTDWVAGTPAARFTKDSSSNVSVQGRLKINGVSFTTNPFDLPSGYRPTRNLTFVCTTFDNGGGTYGTVNVSVDTSGNVVLLDYSAPSPVTDGVIDFSSINFNTL